MNGSTAGATSRAIGDVTGSAATTTARAGAGLRATAAAAAMPLVTAAAMVGVMVAAAAARAMDAPWWENYDHKDRYLCGQGAVLVVERNQSQASLINGQGRLILFREASDRAGMLYRNEEVRILVNGDELIFEQLPIRRVCLRTEQV
jgi:hypothetical protein